MSDSISAKRRDRQLLPTRNLTSARSGKSPQFFAATTHLLARILALFDTQLSGALGRPAVLGPAQYVPSSLNVVTDKYGEPERM